MNLNLGFFFPVVLFPLLTDTALNGQQTQLITDNPDLKDSGRKIENTISFYTSRSNYETIKSTAGQKTSLKTETLIINGDTLKPERIETRGHTTLYLRRKNYSFKLKSQASFRHGETTEEFKKFFVLSLTMDRNYCNNRLAFEMMETSRLFGLFYSFCELRVNGRSEGIYMVIERPEDWAKKKKDSPLFIRRGYDHSIDKIETDKKIGKDEAKKYSKYFRLIYSSLNKFEGEELYKTLSGWLDMDAYMKWLAFNFIVRNSDYTDEVYFYIDPEIDKFNIIPWDYDDLFASAPHEGNIENKKVLEGKFIFSAEDMLDKKIASDTYLHKVYLIQFREVLNQLSPAVLKRIFEETYSELYPYYSDNEIICMSGFDIYKDASLERLKRDLLSLYNNLIISRNIYLKYLENKHGE